MSKKVRPKVEYDLVHNFRHDVHVDKKKREKSGKEKHKKRLTDETES